MASPDRTEEARAGQNRPLASDLCYCCGGSEISLGSASNPDAVCADCGAVDEFLVRACIECPSVYAGLLKCPECGGPGEPIE